ncbi:hypothetical protein HanIR_Chr03g0120451 [Helianthus annuus]|nr:hypothetical protein HanIR_Chr03g0120451 [Helianthus annuus]
MLGRNSDGKGEKTFLIQEDFKINEHGFGKAVIAVMKDLKALKEAGNTISDLMAGAGVIQYVGGRSIMVSFNCSEEVDRFCLLSKDKSEIFQSVEKWSGQSLPFERIAWLRIQGIPLHLLQNEVLNGIGEKFGKIIQGGKHGVWDSDLSYDYVGVLVSEGKRIQEEVVIQWKGRRYRVWVEEHIGDWEPEFLSKNSGVEEDQNSKVHSQSSEKAEQGNQGRSQADGILPGVAPLRDLERPKDQSVIMEGIIENQSVYSGISIFPKIVKDTDGLHKETYVYYGDDVLERDAVVREDGPSQKNNRKVIKKVGSGRVVTRQPKLISVDDRPTTRKRPRLDIDPNGLDRFGLNALLGLSIGQQLETELNTTLDKDGETVSADSSSQNLNVAEEDRQVEDDREHDEDTRINDRVPAVSVEPDEDISNDDEVPKANENGNKDVMEEIENTIKLRTVMGANFEGFGDLVSDTVEEEGIQSGKI